MWTLDLTKFQTYYCMRWFCDMNLFMPYNFLDYLISDLFVRWQGCKIHVIFIIHTARSLPPNLMSIMFMLWLLMKFKLIVMNWFFLFLSHKCFIDFLHQEQYDTHDPLGRCSVVLPFLLKRTKVTEIVAARDIVFALAHSGVCAAFSRGS